MRTHLILVVLAFVGMAVLIVIGIILLSMWDQRAKEAKDCHPTTGTGSVALERSRPNRAR